jgi:DNA-binding response OmpR family regulator
MTKATRVHSTPPTNTPVCIARNQQKAVLRVGSLELNLTNRTARRGDRSFYLRPREFRLLRYMMQRCGQLLTRAKLLEDVWSYKFVPESMILVDVHMGRLRRKVNGPNEAPMISTVRGAGFILSAADPAEKSRRRSQLNQAEVRP